MSRLFQFLLKLRMEEFYGDIRIRFQKGRVHGQIEVNTAHLEETLPQPDVTSPEYQKALRDVVTGVSLPT